MAKAIQGSVGKSGVNGSQSVLIIQYLLNCVPAGNGGPVTELAVDGIAGPKTIAAIERFQKANFGSSDGKVDSQGNTLKALQQFDPFPQIPLVMKGQPSKGLKIGGMPGYKPRKGEDLLGYKTGDKFGGLPGYKPR
jgi:peptidoglycan hydrolase-like protein with peptidoglycan-binding domain